MRRQTVLIEFANGGGPGYHAGMQVLGGDVVAVQFSDALAELERVNELNAHLLEALQSIVDDYEFCRAHPAWGDRGESYAETALLAIAAATGETK